ncbi:hypothetical protein ZWY2020_051649 [Hordeum vulgare]|nr:hypothetical protein ZWY2020_051649 [Hordeum vulgare]
MQIWSAAQDDEFEKLKAELEQAKKEDTSHKATIEQAAPELSSIKVETRKHEPRVVNVQQQLQEASSKCEALEEKSREQVTELSRMPAEVISHQVEWRFYEEEVRQAKQKATGKQYLLQCAFGGNWYVFLTRTWRSLGSFTNLPRSVAEANKHYSIHDGDFKQRLFGTLFQTHELNPSPSYQIKQLMELHRMAEPAIRDLCIQLWPTEPLPSSYFVLVEKLVDAMPWIEVLKRSVCIEGAWMAFARTLVHYPWMKPLMMATTPPPAGEEHKCPDQYFTSVMESAWVRETQCSKAVIFE